MSNSPPDHQKLNFVPPRSIRVSGLLCHVDLFWAPSEGDAAKACLAEVTGQATNAPVTPVISPGQLHMSGWETHPLEMQQAEMTLEAPPPVNDPQVNADDVRDIHHLHPVLMMQ